MLVVSMIALLFFASTLMLLDRFSRIVLSNYRESVGFFKDSIAFELRNIENTATQLQLFNRTLALYFSRDAGAFSNARLYTHIEYFRNAVSSLSLLSDLYVYYPASGYVVGDRGSYSARGYYFFLSGLSRNHERWLQAIEHAAFGYSLIVDWRTGERKLILKRWIPGYIDAADRAVMIAEISREQIDRLLSGLTRTYSDTVVGIPGYTAVGNNAHRFGTFLTEERQGEAEDTMLVLSEVLAGEQLILSLISSKDDILHRVRTLRSSALLMFFLCLAVSVGIALYLVTRNLRPLHRLAAGLNIDTRGSIDELDLVNRHIERILRENMLLQRRNDADLLYEAIYNPLHNRLDTYRTELGYTYFLMASAMISHPGSACSDEELFRQLDVFERDCSDLFLVVLVHERCISFLLNLEDEAAADGILEAVRAFMAERGIARCLGVSSIVDNAASIPILSYQAFEALKAGHEGIHRFDGTEPTPGTMNEAYRTWRSHLVHRRFQSAGEITEQVLERYLDETLYPVVQESRRYAVVNQMVESLHGLTHADRGALAARLLTSKGKAELIRGCREALAVLSSTADADCGKRQRRMGSAVKAIIDANITNPDLCLTFISEELHLSSSYISRIFHRQYGRGVVDYINRLRIEKAKQMLGAGRHTIKHIARSVGYSSDMNFIRVFKRYENITPGQFGT